MGRRKTPYLSRNKKNQILLAYSRKTVSKSANTDAAVVATAKCFGGKPPCPVSTEEKAQEHASRLVGKLFADSASRKRQRRDVVAKLLLSDDATDAQISSAIVTSALRGGEAADPTKTSAMVHLVDVK
jgi:hypothetical protein